MSKKESVYKIEKLIENNENHNEPRYCEKLQSSQLALACLQRIYEDLRRKSEKHRQRARDIYTGVD